MEGATPEEKNRSKYTVQLVKDEPTSSTAFQPHASIATAIFSLIRSQRSCSIALLGTWGSGKSTVVKLLQQELRDKNFHCFVFDTWAHSGDPLRKSFLNRLNHDLVEVAWLDAGKAEKRLNALSGNRVATTRSRSQVSILGLFAGISLLVSGLSIPLDRLDVLQDWSGRSLFIAALWAAPALFLLIALIILLARAIINRAPMDWSSLLPIVSKVDLSVSSERIEQAEPTSIEFETVFVETLSEAMSSDERQLILVVDNLDRIDPTEAKKVWATMRTFIEPRRTVSKSFWERVWLIVPLDPSSAELLWHEQTQDSGSSTSGLGRRTSLAREFVSKSFQLSYSVPNALMSDWKAFFESTLRSAFIPLDDDAVSEVYHVFRRAGTARSTPTPRQIISFVNRLAALYVQWADSVPLPAQAYYACTDGGPAWNITEFLVSDGTKREEVLDLLGTDGTRNLAALHFSVEPKLALQALLSGPLRDAIEDGSSMVEFGSVPGFWLACQSFIENFEHGFLAGGNTRFLANLICALRECDHQSTFDGKRVWRQLMNLCAKVDSWTFPDDRSGKAVRELLAISTDQEIIKYVDAFWRSSEAVVTQGSNAERLTPQFVDGCEEILSWLDQQGKLGLVPDLRLSVSDDLFSEIAITISGRNLNSELRRLFGTKFPDKSIKWLEEQSRNDLWSRKHSCALALLAEFQTADIDFAEITKLLANRVRDANRDTMRAEYEFEALYDLTDKRLGAAYESLTDLVGEGHVANYLIRFERAGMQDAAARSMLALLEFSSRTKTGALVGEASEAYERLSDLKSMAKEVWDQYAGRLSGLIQIGHKESLLVSHLAEGDDLAKLAGSLLVFRMHDDETFVCLAAQEFSTRWTELALGGPDLEEMTISRLCKNHRLATELANKSFDPSLAPVYVQVLAHEMPNEERTLLLRSLSEGLRKLKTSDWELQIHEPTIIELVRVLNESGAINAEHELEDSLLRSVAGDGTLIDPLHAQTLESALAGPFAVSFGRKLIRIACERSGSIESMITNFPKTMKLCESLSIDRDKVFALLLPGVLERAYEIELDWVSSILVTCEDVLRNSDKNAIITFRDRADAKRDTLSEDDPRYTILTKILAALNWFDTDPK